MHSSNTCAANPRHPPPATEPPPPPAPPPLPKRAERKSRGDWSCEGCGTKTTPVRRGGPLGAATLCNACGLRLKKKSRVQKAAVNGGGVAVGKVRKGRKRKEGAKGKGKADVAEVAKAEVEVVAKVAAKKEIVVDGRHAADSQDGDCVGSPTTASCMSQGCMPGSSSPRGEKAESREVSCGRSETEPSAGPSSPNVDVSMGCNEVGGEVRDDLVAAAEAMLAKGDVHAPTVETFPDGIFGAGCDVGEVKMYPVRNGSPVGIVERCALAERRNGMEREIGKLGDELRVLDEHRAFLDQCWKDVNERQGRLLKEYEAMEQKMLDIHLMRQQTLTNHLFIKGELERRSVEFQRLNTVMGPGM